MIQTSQGISSNKGVENIIKYVSKDNAIIFTNNIMSNPDDIDGMTQEILDNAKYLENSRGKNLIQSVTLSLPPDGITPKEQQIEILKNLIDVNEQNRDLKNHLGVIAIHNDTDHCHAHCIYSSNELFGTKRKRVDKKTFLNQQQYLENYRNNHYPNLIQTNHYSQKLEKRMKLAESRMKHLRKAITQKDQIKSKLDIAMSKTNKIDFQKYLKSQNLIVYKRGVKTVGVRDMDKKRNYRMDTLEKGLKDKYIAFEKNINLKLESELKQKASQKQILIKQKQAQERANKIQQTKPKKGRGRGI